MKHLILIFSVFVTSLQAQKSTLYNVYKDGSVKKQSEDTCVRQISLTFETNVPELSLQQISELLKTSEIKLSDSIIKGTYSNFILHFTPKNKIVSVILREGDVMISTIEQDREKTISWWYLGVLISVVLLFINVFFIEHESLYLFVKIINVVTLCLVCLSVIDSLPLSQTLAPIANHSTGLIAVLLVFTVYLMDSYKKDIFNEVLYVLYTLSIITLCIFSYLQI